MSRLIYVDAFVPDNGESALDLLPEAIQKSFREEARANGKGWRLPASESLLDLWGLQPGAAREYVHTRLFGERARREHWDYHELSAGHDCHLEAPERLFLPASRRYATSHGTISCIRKVNSGSACRDKKNGSVDSLHIMASEDGWYRLPNAREAIPEHAVECTKKVG